MSSESPRPGRAGEESGVGELAGCRVLAAFERRASDVVTTLGRHGIETVVAPPMSTIAHPDDAELRRATEYIVAERPDIVVATTGVGITGWLEAADHFGLRSDLESVLASARIISRGAKVTGAVKKAGFTPEWEAPDGLSDELRDYLLAQDLDGAKVAVQFHGSGADGIDADLRAAGADVTALVVYRWGPPSDPEALERSIREVAEGEFDAVLFTSAPGSEAWLREADRLGWYDGARREFADRTLALAVGPVTAGPLIDAGIPVEIPQRWRLGALSRHTLALLRARSS